MKLDQEHHKLTRINEFSHSIMKENLSSFFFSQNWNRKASLISTVEHSIHHRNVYTEVISVLYFSDIGCCFSVSGTIISINIIPSHWFFLFTHFCSSLFPHCAATASCLWLINYEHQISCYCCCYSSQLMVCVFHYDFLAYSAWAISSSFCRNFSVLCLCVSV